MNNKMQRTIEKTAENFRDECSIADYGIQNIFEAAEKTGYRVIRYPLDSDSLLGFALYRDSDRIIFVNSSQVLSREIFSIAHEIGHHKLHITEHENMIIRDDDFTDRNECETEANYFAACLLLPEEKVKKYVRLELGGKDASPWKGLDIARIQTTFNVSYDMTLIRLKTLNLVNASTLERLKAVKVEYSATQLLAAINGNQDLCRAAMVKKVPAEYLEWVITNYQDHLIPKVSLEKALSFVDLHADDFIIPEEAVDNDSIDELLDRMN